ncbi:MAG: ParB N-terminal domain-containing protein [Sphingobium sp.]|nr:ParB N-terminal domain-containing protein [Sphingobium sp.]MBP9156507.1 ParB N-terminal domain-containing protein [Sphingobium sp.]
MSITDIRSLSIVEIPIDTIVPFATNPMEHPTGQISMLKRSMTRFGFTNPVLLTPDNVVIAGHGRLIAAKELGCTHVPAIILSGLTEAEQRAYRIADNAIALKGKWALDLLAIEAQYVLDAGIAPIELGFEMGELDFAIEGAKKEKAKAEEPVPEPARTGPPVSRVGDLWTVGLHRILCGDARDPACYRILMGGEKADMVLTDMPWNVPVNGHVSGLGKIKHPEFPMASGEMGKEEFASFTTIVFQNQADFAKPGALVLEFIDWRSVAMMITVGETIFDRLMNICVWVKPSGGMGSLWRSRHELVCAFRVKGGKHANNVRLGKFGRNRTNVWEYAAPNGFGSERENLKIHPTAKNVEMLADAILDCTQRGGIVLDPFLGSGATILGAQGVGRIGRGMELDPYYVDLAVQRITKEIGNEAVLADGRTFAEVTSERHGGEAAA